MTGAAPWLGRPYADQLQGKEALLRNLFHRDVRVDPNPSPLAYRNRVDVVCTPRAMGLRDGGFSDVRDLEALPLVLPEIDRVYAEVRRWVSDERLARYDLADNTGFLRNVHIRVGAGAQVALTTTTPEHEDAVGRLAVRLAVHSLVWTVGAGEGPQRTHRVYGEPTLAITLAGKTFLTDPHAFFQTSPAMAERAIACMAEHVTGESLCDLYCGVGVIGISLAPKRLVGVDSVAEAVAQARRNAERNGVEAEFVCQDAARFLSAARFDTIVVDPPRTGLGAGAQSLLYAGAQRILYLSCNPKTQARDLVALAPRYAVTRLQGFDFFPQTPHVECLAVLERK